MSAFIDGAVVRRHPRPVPRTSQCGLQRRHPPRSMLYAPCSNSVPHPPSLGGRYGSIVIHLVACASCSLSATRMRLSAATKFIAALFPSARMDDVQYIPSHTTYWYSIVWYIWYRGSSPLPQVRPRISASPTSSTNNSVRYGTVMSTRTMHTNRRPGSCAGARFQSFVPFPFPSPSSSGQFLPPTLRAITRSQLTAQKKKRGAPPFSAPIPHVPIGPQAPPHPTYSTIQ